MCTKIIYSTVVDYFRSRYGKSNTFIQPKFYIYDTTIRETALYQFITYIIVIILTKQHGTFDYFNKKIFFKNINFLRCFAQIDMSTQKYRTVIVQSLVLMFCVMYINIIISNFLSFLHLKLFICAM